MNGTPSGGARRMARELALQALYQHEFNSRPWLEILDDLCREANRKHVGRDYARDLLEGVSGRKLEIDALLQRSLTNWTLDRLNLMDRNVLRIGAYEIRYSPDVPPKVAINEAVEIAKKYGTEESGRFVNGVLDRILGEPPA